MPRWNQSQALLTATTIPLTVVLCWLLYKKATQEESRSRKCKNTNAAKTVETSSEIMNKCKTETCTSENESSKNEKDVKSGINPSVVEDPTVYVCDTKIKMQSHNAHLSMVGTEELGDQLSIAMSTKESQLVDPPGEYIKKCASPLSNSNIAYNVQDAELLQEPSKQDEVSALDVECDLTESLQPFESNNENGSIQDNGSSLSSNAYASETESAAQYEEEQSNSMHHLSSPKLSEEEEIRPVEAAETLKESSGRMAHIIISSKNDFQKQGDHNRSGVSTSENSDENEEPEADKAFPGNLNGIKELEDDKHSDLVKASYKDATNSDFKNSETVNLDSDANTNNNNSIERTVSNHEVDSLVESSHPSQCEKHNKQSGVHKRESANANDVNHHSGMNGWKKKEVNDESEIITEGKVVKKRPTSLLKLDLQDNAINETMQVYVEFPSERVGLLIGKQGRNIKQLKQDSGADVYVHAAQCRDDIQVLQICGTQSEVESCVSRIKRRFNDISLSTFDPANISVSSPNSSIISPVSTPPPLMYPVPNISQLRLPEGVTVEVAVSAIAAVDCLFLQQYTHPSYHGLEGLEQAMSLCYAEPSTPCLPNPVQVGLICAAPQQGMWYRAQIIQCFEESEEILIKFMDYGGYSTLPGKSIKQIRADFVTLPFQAVECYLDNIAPPEDNSFCEETVTKIADMLKEGSFQARVTGYRTDGHPRIHLFKCLNNKVVLVNQEMATKGLATWIEPAPFQSI